MVWLLTSFVPGGNSIVFAFRKLVV